METTVQYLLLSIVVIVLVVAICSGTDWRAWFGTKERPERLLGRTVQLKNCEWLGSTALPVATVSSYQEPEYRLDFVVPVEVEGLSERFARIRARHSGYPLSGATRRATWASGTLESGKGFVARVAVGQETDC